MTVCLAALFATPAAAQDSQWWTNQYGNRARLLGGGGPVRAVRPRFGVQAPAAGGAESPAARVRPRPTGLPDRGKRTR